MPKINGKRYNKKYARAYQDLTKGGFGDLAELLAGSSGKARRGLGYNISDVLTQKQDRINKMNEYQWDIDAMENAGLNSALLYGSGAGSSEPIDSAPSSSTDQFGEGLDATMSSLGSLMSACQLGLQAWSVQKDNAVKDANINLIKSQEALNNAKTSDINQQVEYFTSVRHYREKIENNNANISDSMVIYNQMAAQMATYGVDKAQWESKTAEFRACIEKQNADFHSEYLRLQKLQMENAVQLGALQVAAQKETNAHLKEMLESQIKLLKQQAATQYQQARLLAKQADYYDQDEFVNYMGTANAFLSTVGQAQVNKESIRAGFVKAGFSAEVAAERTENLLSDYSMIINNVLSSINMVYGKSGFYFTTNPNGNGNYGGLTPPVPQSSSNGGTTLNSVDFVDPDSPD